MTELSPERTKPMVGHDLIGLEVLEFCGVCSRRLCESNQIKCSRKGSVMIGSYVSDEVSRAVVTNPVSIDLKSHWRALLSGRRKAFWHSSVQEDQQHARR